MWLAVWLMFMRVVDLFWMIEPTFHEQLRVTVWDIVVPVAIGGFWLTFFFRNLKGRPLLPLSTRIRGRFWNRRMSDQTIRNPENSEHTEYERSDLSAKGIFGFLFGLAVAGVIIHFVLIGMYSC